MHTPQVSLSSLNEDSKNGFLTRGPCDWCQRWDLIWSAVSIVNANGTSQTLWPHLNDLWLERRDIK